MNGYEVQRRLNNEQSFSVRTFVNSLAPGGTSNGPLSYSNIDANSYTDTSFYRLRIVDINGGFTYSDIKAVPGKTKGGGSGGGNPHNLINTDSTITTIVPGKVILQSEAKIQKIIVGPNPNNGNFWFTVNGIDKETLAALYTIDGKLIKQFRVVNLQQQQVTGLRSGIYLLKVQGMETFKVTVQGGGNGLPTNNIAAPLNIKN
jgi:hypothetical protein